MKEQDQVICCGRTGPGECEEPCVPRGVTIGVRLCQEMITEMNSEVGRTTMERSLLRAVISLLDNYAAPRPAPHLLPTKVVCPADTWPFPLPDTK